MALLFNKHNWKSFGCIFHFPYQTASDKLPKIALTNTRITFASHNDKSYLWLSERTKTDIQNNFDTKLKGLVC